MCIRGKRDKPEERSYNAFEALVSLGHLINFSSTNEDQYYQVKEMMLPELHYQKLKNLDAVIY